MWWEDLGQVRQILALTSKALVILHEIWIRDFFCLDSENNGADQCTPNFLHHILQTHQSKIFPIYYMYYINRIRKTLSAAFPTRSDTNRAVNRSRWQEAWHSDLEKRGICYLCSEIKGADQGPFKKGAADHCLFYAYENNFIEHDFNPYYYSGRNFTWENDRRVKSWPPQGFSMSVNTLDTHNLVYLSNDSLIGQRETIYKTNKRIRVIEPKGITCSN